MPALLQNSWSSRGLLKFGVLGLALAISSTSFAGQKKPDPKPTNEECLACHGDSTMTKDVNGKPVSLYVNAESFKASIHGGMFSCVDCHTDVKTSPHENTPEKISCATCHAEQQAVYDRSYHAKAIQAGTSKPLLASPVTAARMNCCRQVIRSRE